MKRHSIRLFIGYTLMALLIGIASYILVLRAYGFDINRKTGQVVQKGLVYIDSAPDNASIVVNDEIRSQKTNSRISLEEGDYRLKIQKEQYRNWERPFTLKGGHVERFTYPMLILNTLQPRELATVPKSPLLSTQSPDRRWLLVSQGDSSSVFTEYDLNSLDDSKQPKTRTIAFPATLFSQSESRQLEVVEWSSDNSHVLVKHTFGTSTEFIVLSRETPESSTNISKLLNSNPTEVTLRDKKFDQWYLFTKDGGVLQTANLKDKSLATVLTGVGTYKTHDADTILYTQPVLNSASQRVMLLQDKQSYMVREIGAGAAQLDIARYSGAWYVVVGSDADKKTYVYKDPVKVLSRSEGIKPAPLSVLRHSGSLSDVSFSQNTRFIASRSGQHIEVYDAEYGELYKIDIARPFDANTEVEWMDGHRFIAHIEGKLVMFDFDGSNFQELTTSLPTAIPAFDRDYTVLYTLSANQGSPNTGFYQTNLRLEEDL